MGYKWSSVLLSAALALACWSNFGKPAHAAGPEPNRYYYYPYYYFPHNYWPTMSPKWPEPVGAPYRPAPAYMALPPFLEPHWRYEGFEAQKYYRGFHFWLDQF